MKRILLSIVAFSFLASASLLFAKTETIVYFSSISIAQRLASTPSREFSISGKTFVVFEPSKFGFSGSEPKELSSKIQSALLSNFSRYTGAVSINDELLQRDLKANLLKVDIRNESDNTKAAELSESVQFALFPVISKSYVQYTLSVMVLEIESGKIVASVKSQFYQDVAKLSTDAVNEATLLLCKKLNVSLSSEDKIALQKSIDASSSQALGMKGKKQKKPLSEKQLAKAEAKSKEAQENLRLANIAFGERNYEHALKLYKKASKQKILEAQKQIALIYYAGLGVKKDTATAALWYKKAACQGDAESQTYLALLYETGDGVKQDVFTAAVWYEKAAETNAIAQNNLARMYETSIVFGLNYDKALSLYTLSAEQGNAVALNNLGVMYENGKGVAVDYEKALSFYEQASSKNIPAAFFNLGVMYENGKGVKLDCEKAASYYQQASSKGYAPAQNNLGVLYELGIGVSYDLSSAKSLYEKASGKGDSFGKSNKSRFGQSFDINKYSAAICAYGNGLSERALRQ